MTNSLRVWLAGPPGPVIASLVVVPIWDTSMVRFERVVAVVKEHGD